MNKPEEQIKIYSDRFSLPLRNSERFLLSRTIFFLNREKIDVSSNVQKYKI